MSTAGRGDPAWCLDWRKCDDCLRPSRSGATASSGPGAVVTRDVPEYAGGDGNPARVKSWVCYCGIGLELGGDDGETSQSACEACGRRYRRVGRDVTED